MKIVFMGTPDFAVTVLEGILKTKHEVGLVATQPDKAKKENSIYTGEGKGACARHSCFAAGESQGKRRVFSETERISA